MRVLPVAFDSGSSRIGVFPGVLEHQHVVFGHNALLCGALEVSGAASGVCSQTSSDGEPLPHLEPEITVVVCPDHARSTSSCLAPTGGAAQAAPSCRFLGRDSDQASGHCPECLAVAAAGWVCSQGSKSNNRWCSITMSFSVVPSEVVGAASDFCSGIPSGGGPCPPLESGVTVVVCSCHLQTMQEAPCPT